MKIMNEILIFIFVVENIYFVYRYYKKPMGIFSPVFILSMLCLGQLLPQLTTMYFLPNIYSPHILPNLVYTMITGNLAFYIGWERKMSIYSADKKIVIFEIKGKWLKILIGFFSFCAILFTHFLKLNSRDIDGVFAFQFQGLGFLGLILSIIYLKKYPTSKFVVLCLIISTIPIIEYALSIYGSRQSLFTLALLYSYLAVCKMPHKYVFIKRAFFVFFIMGFIGSISIVEVRSSMHSENGYLNGFDKIDFIDNIKKSFTNSYNDKSGMDLGNAGLAIERCNQKGQYNYGFFIWNGFVYNYVPRRLVGEKTKNSLMFFDDMRDYIDSITNKITCTTGYYDSFSAFSYLGFLLFYLLARLFKYIRLKARYSTFYEMLFLFALVNSSVAATHGVQLVLSKFEYIILLFLVLWFTLKEKNIVLLKSKSQ